TLCDIPPSRLETGDFQVATFVEPGVKKTILQYSGERVETTMEQRIEQYRKLYTEAGTGGEETNDQYAYKNILTTLRNSTDLVSARRRIQAIRGWCTNQDRREVYQAFLDETDEHDEHGNNPCTTWEE